MIMFKLINEASKSKKAFWVFFVMNIGLFVINKDQDIMPLQLAQGAFLFLQIRAYYFDKLRDK